MKEGNQSMRNLYRPEGQGVDPNPRDIQCCRPVVGHIVGEKAGSACGVFCEVA